MKSKLSLLAFFFPLFGSFSVFNECAFFIFIFFFIFFMKASERHSSQLPTYFALLDRGCHHQQEAKELPEGSYSRSPIGITWLIAHPDIKQFFLIWLSAFLLGN